MYILLIKFEILIFCDLIRLFNIFCFVILSILKINGLLDLKKLLLKIIELLNGLGFIKYWYLFLFMLSFEYVLLLKNLFFIGLFVSGLI